MEHLKKYLQAYLVILIGFSISFGLFYALHLQEENYILNIAQLRIGTIHNHIHPGLAFDTHIFKKPDVAAILAPQPVPKEENTHLINIGVPLSWGIFLFGIFITLLLARSITLSKLLKEKTRILNEMNQNLKKEIMEHNQTEESKKTLEKALLQGQKLQAIGTLAGGIAHDFNNILYAIRGYIELAQDTVSHEEITYKNLGKVLDATHRGQDLIAQILAFSRRQHHELSSIHLKTEMAAALSLLRPAVPESVDIQFNATTDIKIMGNKTQIHQILVNLINNAVDAMDSEGKILISLSQVSSSDLPHLKFSPLPLLNYCKISISDTGHGMDQNTMDRIFEPFFTTKEVGKGTGLGLSIVHAIVKEHQGEITVNSQIGQGTTFTLFFPEYSPL